ncbi:hypothetical protein HOLleu_40378 [Holothuria leucospilota]|uniref:NACHT domain-containing protein n=1 Tax=Holothuria leucospilota TaxID=206669 RepID=A0A9Q0YG11_HOLLE|nr:hypothetical protein HOLleu_40378 [Holothuria leucospilota]
MDYLIQGLQEFNNQICFILPVPGCDAVSVTAVYTDIQCLVTAQTGEAEEVSSDIFLKKDFITKERFVVFQGKLGYGKTVLVLRMLHEVLSNRNCENDSIIIYVSVQNYNYSTTLFDIVKGQLPKENIISEEDFEETLQVSKFLVILDGFYGDFANALGDHELAMGSVEPSTTSSSMESANCKTACTIAKLLDPAFIDKYKNIKLWVTTREPLPCKIPVHLPFKKVEIKGFSDKSRELFISKVYATRRSFAVDKDRETEGMSLTFVDNKQQSVTRTPSSTGAETAQSASGEGTLKASIIQDQHQHSENCRTIGVLVNRAKENFNLMSEFLKTPLYLDIFVRHTLAKVVKDGDSSQRDMLFNKLPEWMRVVVSILEWRYVQRSSKEDKVIKGKISKLRPELGKIAVNMKFSGQIIGTLNEWRNWLDLDMIKTALSIGYLRVRNRHQDKGLCTVIEFQDSYFTDYFAGFYFPSDNEIMKQLENIIMEDTEEETNQLIIFICGYQQSLKKAVLKRVLKYDKIYILVDIMTLGINPEESNFKEILKSKHFTMKISSHDLEKRENELQKFGHFCKKNNVSCYFILWQLLRC